MPLYEYVCRPCELSFESFQRMSEEPLKDCPFCEKQTLERLFSVPHVKIPDNPKTLGELAEYNTKKMSAEDREIQTSLKKEKRRRAVKELENKTGAKLMESTAIPWWRNGENGTKYSEKLIDTSKITNIKRYIETGKT
jgi:putative FmdB family regulatory protein